MLALKTKHPQQHEKHALAPVLRRLQGACSAQRRGEGLQVAASPGKALVFQLPSELIQGHGAHGMPRSSQGLLTLQVELVLVLC